MPSYPVPEKTWQYDVNISLPSAGSSLADHRQVWRRIKNALIGFGSNPWTVRGSSNAVTAGMDAVDRWASDADLVWALYWQPRSWIVLRQAGLATNFELLIILSNRVAGVPVFPNQNLIYYSPAAGFAGGDTINRPTAADEVILTEEGVLDTSNNPFDCSLHVMQSTDGECTRVVPLIKQAPGTHWIVDSILMFEKPKTPVSSGWTNQILACVANGAPGGLICSYHSSAPWYGSFSGEGDYNVGKNDLTNEYFIRPLTASCPTQFVRTLQGNGLLWGDNIYRVSKTGRHARIYDAWYSAALTSPLYAEANYPSGGTRTLMQFGRLILPWDGSLLVGREGDSHLDGYFRDDVITAFGSGAGQLATAVDGAHVKGALSSLPVYSAPMTRVVFLDAAASLYNQARSTRVVVIPTED